MLGVQFAISISRLCVGDGAYSQEWSLRVWANSPTSLYSISARIILLVRHFVTTAKLYPTLWCNQLESDHRWAELNWTELVCMHGDKLAAAVLCLYHFLRIFIYISISTHFILFFRADPRESGSAHQPHSTYAFVQRSHWYEKVVDFNDVVFYWYCSSVRFFCCLVNASYLTVAFMLALSQSSPILIINAIDEDFA